MYIYAYMDTSQIYKVAAITLKTQSKLQRYIELGLQGSSNTQRAYRSDVTLFQNWCSQKGYSFPSSDSIVLAEYYTECIEQADMKWATLQRSLNGIRKFYKLAGKQFPDDELLKSVIIGIKREIGVKQRQAPAFRAEPFAELLDTFDENNLIELRDKCLLLTGLMGAFRRSELVAVNIEHLKRTPEGYIITIPRSKTNQYGEIEFKALFVNELNSQRCPVQVMDKWLSCLGRSTGPLFTRLRRGAKPGDVRRTLERLADKRVGLILKHYMGDEYSAHSLRASFVTISKRNGADDSSIQEQTGHKSSKMIQRYTRRDSIFENNSASKINL